MVYKSGENEKEAALACAQLMSAAARTAPKGRGIDTIETQILDGEEKDRLADTMREIVQKEMGKDFFVRDAANIDACHCVLLIASSGKPRGLNCGWCGVADCTTATMSGITCAFASIDFGIATGSAASVAMDHRMDNRIQYSAGTAALEMKLFPDDMKMCLGIGLSTSGKDIFFDRA